MLALEPEMTFTERIEGPLGPTVGTPARLCWQVADARLDGSRISARLAMPGTDWIRLGENGSRHQDQRTQFLSDDGALILMRYDVGLIRGDAAFLDALAAGRETDFGDQYMCIAPQFEVGSARYAWLMESLFVGRGRLAGPRRVEYQLYRVP